MKNIFHKDHLPDMRVFALASASLITSVSAWEPGPSQGDAITGLAVDATNRNDVVSFYHCIYRASENGNPTIDWTGNIGNCQAGTTSPEFKNHVLRRINWFRAMAGVPADITFDPTRNNKCQDAALMMARNNALSHTPPNSWSCYTAGGYQAANKGNLSLGSFGVQAVNRYIDDTGTNNAAVGHRRWLLAPRVQGMGTGDIPKTDDYNSANCIWVIGENRSPALPAMTSAWPPEGFVPWQVVFDRWSYSFGNADFSNARVSMTHGGEDVPLTIESRTASGIGDNSIVWNAPSTTGPVTDDQTYSITITGIQNAGQATVSYDVTIIDPNQFTEEVEILGAEEIPSNGGIYQIIGVEGASNYELSISQVIRNTTSEGAENATSEFIIDGTPDGNFRSNSAPRNGSRSFHLTPPDFFQSEFFELDRDFLTGPDSELTFYVLEGFATDTTVLRSEISTNGGGSWITVWEKAGKGSSDRDYQKVSIPLSEYPNQPVRVRFQTKHLGGSIYPSGNSNAGFLIDDISVTGSSLESGAHLTDLGTNLQFTLNSATAGKALVEDDSYLVKVRPVVGCNTFGFSDPLTVTINEDASVDGFTTWLAGYPGAGGGLTGDPDKDGIENGIEYLMGTDPMKATSQALIPQPGRQGDTVTLTLENTIALSGIEIKMAMSEDLKNWTLFESSTDGPDHNFSVEVEGMDQVYFRIVVTAAP